MVAQSNAFVFDRPSYHEVARLAYEIWLMEGKPEGRSAEHWAMAEDLLTSRAEVPTAPAPLPRVGATRRNSYASPAMMNRKLAFLASTLS
jgi:hypothetical protein